MSSHGRDPLQRSKLVSCHPWGVGRAGPSCGPAAGGEGAEAGWEPGGAGRTMEAGSGEGQGIRVSACQRLARSPAGRVWPALPYPASVQCRREAACQEDGIDADAEVS